LFNGTSAFLNANRERVIALAAHHGLPAMYAQREAATAGGLMSLRADLPVTVAERLAMECGGAGAHANVRNFVG
jgi:hypothetical protein